MKAKRKTSIGATLILTLIVGVYLFMGKVETTFYIGIANPSENIDVLVKIDDRNVFNDTVRYNPFKYRITTERLRGGFHELYILSHQADLAVKKNIFLIFDQHVVIEYFPHDDKSDTGASFFIRNRFSPFILSNSF